MATFKSIIEIIKIFLWAVKYFKGEITEAIFNHKIKSIRKAIKKAGEGSLEDRLEGGQDVENNFNKHGPK